MKQVLDAAGGDERQAGYQAGIQAALKAIAAIPAPASLDQMNGHEDAYRAVETLVAAKMPPSPDRRAIKMLVDTGCVPREVANRALQVAHGFERGPVTVDGTAAPEFEPDTFFLIDCPGWPGGLAMGSLEAALDHVQRYGNERTRIATWKQQAGRRDYTPREVRAMLAARGGESDV